MPNPWDVGSARLLEQLGFEALATTSAGLAWSLGRADNQLTLEQVLKHLRAVVDAVDLPVHADYEGGFAVEPAHVATNVKRAADTGVAGLSIEDSSGDEAHPLFEFDLAVERIGAARRAIDQSGTGLLLTGRSEGYVVGRPDLDETIRRLRAYAEAGADCLYAPRISDLDDVAEIVAAVSPKPVNLLINAPFTTVAQAGSSEYGGSAWAALLRAPLGVASWRRHGRSPSTGRSPGSRGCLTSMPCSNLDQHRLHAAVVTSTPRGLGRAAFSIGRGGLVRDPPTPSSPNDAAVENEADDPALGC
jgi:hypothetical protein